MNALKNSLNWLINLSTVKEICQLFKKSMINPKNILIIKEIYQMSKKSFTSSKIYINGPRNLLNV